MLKRFICFMIMQAINDQRRSGLWRFTLISPSNGVRFSLNIETIRPTQPRQSGPTSWLSCRMFLESTLAADIDLRGRRVSPSCVERQCYVVCLDHKTYIVLLVWSLLASSNKCDILYCTAKILFYRVNDSKRRFAVLKDVFSVDFHQYRPIYFL